MAVQVLKKGQKPLNVIGGYRYASEAKEPTSQAKSPEKVKTIGDYKMSKKPASQVKSSEKAKVMSDYKQVTGKTKKEQDEEEKERLRQQKLKLGIAFKKGGSVAKPGLYANIHAKKKRIAAGSGEKMRKVGSKGAPSKMDFIKSAKTAKRGR
jgi:hypothetical protein